MCTLPSLVVLLCCCGVVVLPASPSSAVFPLRSVGSEPVYLCRSRGGTEGLLNLYSPSSLSPVERLCVNSAASLRLQLSTTLCLLSAHLTSSILLLVGT